MMTTSTQTQTHHHGRHCSHAAHGLSERGALAYLYWPTAAAVLMTIGAAENIARFLGLA